MKPPVGGSTDGCNGTTDYTIGQFYMEQKACKMCRGQAILQNTRAFPTDATRNTIPDKFAFVQVPVYEH